MEGGSEERTQELADGWEDPGETIYWGVEESESLRKLSSREIKAGTED